MKRYDVIIVGGGLAGLTGALHLRQEGYHVLVFEKQAYPHHKVCGEYVSNEIIPYLHRLGVSLLKAVTIDTLQLTTQKGVSLQTPLPLGGLGISRYTLDNTLYQRALELGVAFIFESVSSITFSDTNFNVIAESEVAYHAPIVLGAYGKRSQLDKQLDRNFINQKSPWLGVKAHYSYPGFQKNLVALHNFKGGYGGLSKTETGAINFCYLASYKNFRQEKDIENFNNKVVAKNPFLGQFLQTATPLFDKPLSIAQLSFEKKQAVENHILMCGDTAGLIHPLCGNGMAMAIHSAKIASELISKYFKQDDFNRTQLEKTYSRQWKQTFAARLAAGRQLQSILMKPVIADQLIGVVAKSPRLLRKLIRKTHGRPILE